MRASRTTLALRVGWLVVAAAGIALTFSLGFAGALGFLGWGALAAPLAWETVRTLARTGRAPSAACVRYAGGLGFVLAGSSAAFVAALWALAGGEGLGSGPLARVLGFSFGLSAWALLAAQVGFVAQTTCWMWRQLQPWSAT